MRCNDMMDKQHTERYRKMIQEHRLERMMEVLEGLDLTEENKRFAVWLSGWEESTAEQFIDIISKCRREK